VEHADTANDPMGHSATMATLVQRQIPVEMECALDRTQLYAPQRISARPLEPAIRTLELAPAVLFQMERHAMITTFAQEQIGATTVNARALIRLLVRVQISATMVVLAIQTLEFVQALQNRMELSATMAMLAQGQIGAKRANARALIRLLVRAQISVKMVVLAIRAPEHALVLRNQMERHAMITTFAQEQTAAKTANAMALIRLLVRAQISVMMVVLAIRALELAPVLRNQKEQRVMMVTPAQSKTSARMDNAGGAQCLAIVEINAVAVALVIQVLEIALGTLNLMEHHAMMETIVPAQIRVALVSAQERQLRVGLLTSVSWVELVILELELALLTPSQMELLATMAMPAHELIGAN